MLSKAALEGKLKNVCAQAENPGRTLMKEVQACIMFAFEENPTSPFGAQCFKHPGTL